MPHPSQDIDVSARRLSSPTVGGQTAHLTKLHGAVVARACWNALPYYVREAWGHRTQIVTDAQLLAFVRTDASPVALLLVADHPDLTTKLRAGAQRRLDTMNLDADALATLLAHFEALLRQSRQSFIKHLSGAKNAREGIDRLDLLAEAVALRDAQADVQTERSLLRAFRAMFSCRDPFVVWLIVCACLGAFLLFSRWPSTGGARIYDALALPPDLTRPWALLTFSFLHDTHDWRHVGLNMLSLVLVGQVIELLLGHSRFFLVFMACAVGGGVASVIFRGAMGLPFSTVGASGAVAGVAGLALFLGLWFQARYGRLPNRYIGSTLFGGAILVSNIVVSATGGDIAVDHGAHIGGLIVGLAFGAWLRPSLAAQADARFGRGIAP